jgi:hypothetical protein
VNQGAEAGAAGNDCAAGAGDGFMPTGEVVAEV